MFLAASRGSAYGRDVPTGGFCLQGVYLQGVDLHTGGSDHLDSIDIYWRPLQQSVHILLECIFVVFVKIPAN